MHTLVDRYYYKEANQSICKTLFALPIVRQQCNGKMTSPSVQWYCRGPVMLLVAATQQLPVYHSRDRSYTTSLTEHTQHIPTSYNEEMAEITFRVTFPASHFLDIWVQWTIGLRLKLGQLDRIEHWS